MTQGKHFVLRIFLLATALLLILQLPGGKAGAINSTATIYPTSTIGTPTGWTTGGTGDNTCTGFCDYVDERTTDGDTTYLRAPNSVATSVQFGLGATTSSGESTTSIVVHAVGKAEASSLGYAATHIVLTIAGVAQASQDVSFNTTSYQDLSVTFTGTWTKSNVDGATVTITKDANGLQANQRMTTVYAVVNYQSPAQNQNSSRFYTNANSATPGAPLAATNTTSETPVNAPFRLRMGLTVSDLNWTTGSWGSHNNIYKLQYAQLTAASCSAQSTGWTDVSSSTGVRWFDNTSVADNASISAMGSSNDPSIGTTNVYQTYRESNGFTNSSTITNGNTGIWDFSLTTSGQTAGTSYCFKIVQNDGVALNAYSTYPQLTVTGSLSIGIVDGSGNTVATPAVTFPSQSTTTHSCAASAGLGNSTGTLGISSQRVRVTNNLVTNGWNLSIAATSGPTASWSSGAHNYDFNDPNNNACTDGADADAFAGDLAVNPASATISPASGCSTTGVSGGSQAAFNEGTTNSITLLSATSSSQRFCYWDLTGVNLNQTIPDGILAGSYSISMTLTVTAL